MPETAAHPGVRSLLARFENNKSSTETSPPSRGRSPTSSDNATTRPLSRVRANFVAVERNSHSPSGLGKPNGQTDGSSGLKSPFSPASEGTGAVKGDYFSLRNGSDCSQKAPSEQTVKQDGSSRSSPENTTLQHQSAKTESSRVSVYPSSNETPRASKENTNSAAATAGPTASKTTVPAKKVTNRPSNANIARSDSTNKLTPKAASITTTPKVATPRVTASSETVRSSKSAASSESVKPHLKTVAHKSSRSSLNHTAKTTTGTNRASTPSRDAAGGATASTLASPSARQRSKTPTRTARLPNSVTAPALSSMSKGGVSSQSPLRNGASPGVTRKSSTLKATTTANLTPSGSPATSSLRKQSSRASLPHQESADRPRSRVGTKPVDEGFLARMMRPTASSASKAHEKVDVKSPPRPKVARGPLKSAKEGDRAAPAALAKARTASQKLHEELSTEGHQHEHHDEEGQVASAPQEKTDPVSEEQVAPSESEVEQPAAEPVATAVAEIPVIDHTGGIMAEVSPEEAAPSDAPPAEVVSEQPAETLVESAHAQAEPAQEEVAQAANVDMKTAVPVESIQSAEPAQQLAERATQPPAEPVSEEKESVSNEPILEEKDSDLDEVTNTIAPEEQGPKEDAEKATPAAEPTEEKVYVAADDLD